MLSRSFVKPIALSVGVSAGLLLGSAGCGGPGDKIDDAVATPAPGEASYAGAGASGSSGAAASGGSTTAKADTSSTAAKTETAKTETAPAAATASGWGTLKGKVVFDGAAPAAKMLVPKGAGDKDFKDGVYCGKEGVPAESLLVDAETKGVRNVIVWISKPSAVNPELLSASKELKLEFDQKNCTFSPHAMGFPAGTTVVIKSSDTPGHNVHGVLNLNGQFNNAISSGQSIPYLPKFAERRPVKIVCDIHPWMTAWWMITDSPYVTVTDAKGNFELKNVPAGAQKVVVWQESLDKQGFLTPSSGDAVTIKAGGETTLDFKVPAARVASGG